jgi:hypothetical protein
MKLWERHEEDIALWVPGGYRVPGSGSQAEKLDVGTDQDRAPWRFMYGCKSSTQKGIRITAEMWREVETAVNRRSPDHRPALPIRLYDPRPRPRAEDVPILFDAVLLDFQDHVEMLEELHRKA